MITAATQVAMNLKIADQLNDSLDASIHINEERPPVQDPYIADTRHTAPILENGLEIGRYNGLSLIWIQLQPFQIRNEVSIKKRLAATSSKGE